MKVRQQGGAKFLAQMGWFTQKMAVEANKDHAELKARKLNEKNLALTYLLERAFERLQTLTVIVNESNDKYEVIRGAASVANVMRQIAENEAYARPTVIGGEEQIPRRKIDW